MSTVRVTTESTTFLGALDAKQPMNKNERCRYNDFLNIGKIVWFEREIKGYICQEICTILN